MQKRRSEGRRGECAFRRATGSRVHAGMTTTARSFAVTKASLGETALEFLLESVTALRIVN